MDEGVEENRRAGVEARIYTPVGRCFPVCAQLNPRVPKRRLTVEWEGGR